MSTCRKDPVDTIFFRFNVRFCSLDAVPLAGPDLELVLVFYRIAKLVLKARLHAKLFHALSRALLQCIRVFAEYSENLLLLREAFLLFNNNSFNRRMRFFLLNPLFELTNVLAFLGQEIEVSLKVGVYD